MTILPEWLMIQLEGMAIGYAAVASGALEWWIRKLKKFHSSAFLLKAVQQENSRLIFTKKPEFEHEHPSASHGDLCFILLYYLSHDGKE